MKKIEKKQIYGSQREVERQATALYKKYDIDVIFKDLVKSYNLYANVFQPPVSIEECDSRQYEIENLLEKLQNFDLHLKKYTPAFRINKFGAEGNCWVARSVYLLLRKYNYVADVYYKQAESFEDYSIEIVKIG